MFFFYLGFSPFIFSSCFLGFFIFYFILRDVFVIWVWILSFFISFLKKRIFSCCFFKIFHFWFLGFVYSKAFLSWLLIVRKGISTFTPFLFFFSVSFSFSFVSMVPFGLMILFFLFFSLCLVVEKMEETKKKRTLCACVF